MTPRGLFSSRVTHGFSSVEGFLSPCWIFGILNSAAKCGFGIGYLRPMRSSLNFHQFLFLVSIEACEVWQLFLYSHYFILNNHYTYVWFDLARLLKTDSFCVFVLPQFRIHSSFQFVCIGVILKWFWQNEQ